MISQETIKDLKIISTRENLKRLEFAKLKISDMPDSIEKCVNLRELSIKNSLIERIGDFIGELEKLKKIRIYGCGKFKYISEEVGRCRELRNL